MYFNAIFNNYLSNLVTDPIFEENEIIVDESYLLESDTRTDWIEPDPFNTFIMYEEPDGYHESIMDELDTGEPIIFESEVYDNSVQYDNDNISVDCETIMDKLRTDELILFEPEIDDASFQFENTSVDWSMLDEDLLSEHNNNDELVYADISPTVISPDDHCEANSNVTSAIPTRAESSPVSLYHIYSHIMIGSYCLTFGLLWLSQYKGTRINYVTGKCHTLLNLPPPSKRDVGIAGLT